MRHSNNLLHDHIHKSKLAFIKDTQHVCVGLSGGIDSVVLLHSLTHTIPSKYLSAIHIHHGISPHADNWAQFCQELCTKLNIPLHIEKVTLKRSGGESLENIARSARHNILLSSTAQIIALAHHQNDQIETTLSQIFRGSDLHNIAGMHEISKRQNKLLWRPLLPISRAQIEEYTKIFQLEYITDESNFNIKFLRNFVRHSVLPLLEGWDANINNKLLNFNGQLQKLLSITDQVGMEDLNKCSQDNLTINIEIFRQFSFERQINLLSRFILVKQLPLPGHRQLIEFNQQALTCEWDRKPQLTLTTDTSLIKYKNNISLATI